MKKLLIVSLMMLSGIASAKNPPRGWVSVSDTNVFRETTAMVYGNNRGEVYRAEVWAWTPEQEYIKITVGCSYDSYKIEKDGKIIVDRSYNPGHPFWSIKKGFCY